LGTDARFIGAVRWTLDQPQLHGLIQGRVDPVNLASLLPAGSPHAMRGNGHVELAELSWHGSRIERLAGTLVGEHAQASRSFVVAMAKDFKCPQYGEGVPAADDAAMIALDLLAIQFELNGKGLTFWGHCPPEANMQAGCMAVSGSQPLLFGPPYRDWSFGLLIQTLMAPPDAWLPATRSAIEMAERLPLPLN